MTEKRKIQLDVLDEYRTILSKSITALEYSIGQCERIGIKEEYSQAEAADFEALTSRFARMSDIYTQKYLRAIFEILGEFPSSIIDMLNSAEKKSLINDVDLFMEARTLRNDIAHEYWIENLKRKFTECLNLSRPLISEIKRSFNQERILISFT